VHLTIKHGFSFCGDIAWPVHVVGQEGQLPYHFFQDLLPICKAIQTSDGASFTRYMHKLTQQWARP